MVSVKQLRVGAAIAASVMALAACGSSKDTASNKDKAASSGTTTTTKAMDHDMDHGAHDHGDGGHDDGGHGTVLEGTATGDSPCETALAKPTSPGQANASGAEGTDAEGGHGHRGMIKQEPITKAEREQLAIEMEQARGVIKKYPTVKDAEAAGYKMSTVFVPCIGAHYTNMQLLTKFDPSAPSELLYDGITPDAKIVGLSYLVWHPGGAPEGFAGPNDHFHQHNANGGLCLKNGVVVGGEAQTEEECKKAGGKKSADLMKDVWMAHAWVAPGWECSWGVFAGECPELGGRLGGTAWDEPKKD